jgi:hypothetical protein
MAQSKAFVMPLPFVKSVKTTGGSLGVSNGVLAIVDLSKSTATGAKVLSSFLGLPKDQKTLAIQVGGPDREAGKSDTNKAARTLTFALNEVKKIMVSAPTRTKHIVDDVTIGYNGTDADTAFNFKKGQAPFNISLKIDGGAIAWRGGGDTTYEFLNTSIDIPGCSPFDSCVDCDDCEEVDCKTYTLNLIEKIKNQPITGGGVWGEYVDITPILSCDTESTVVTTEMQYREMSICDTGDNAALASVRSQYDYPVIRKDRKGSTSIYEVLVPEGTVLANYEQTIASVLKGCDTCPEGFDAVEGGILYAITIEDSGANRVSVIEAALARTKLVAGTLTRAQGNDGGVGFYTGVYSSEITDAEIAAFVGSTANARNTATVAKVGAVVSICNNDTVTEAAWVETSVCEVTSSTYEITLPDTECGEDRLAEIQSNYPNLTIAIKKTGSGTRALTLTGSSGTANVNVDGVNYLATYATSLTVTATNFVTTHAAALLAEGVVVTAAAGVLTFQGENVIIDAITFTNATTNADEELVGTLAGSVHALVQTGCNTVYTTTVVSDMVCEECDDIYRDYYVTEAPAPFSLKAWTAVPFDNGLPSGNCLCGIRFRGKVFTLSPGEATRDMIDFEETSVRIQVSAGYPTELREGIGYIAKGEYVAEYRARMTPRTHLVGNLRKIEAEAAFRYFGRQYRKDYLGRVLMDETSLFQNNTEQLLQYTVEIHHGPATPGIGVMSGNAIQHQIYVPFGEHLALEGLLNNMAANAGIPGVQATGI